MVAAVVVAVIVVVIVVVRPGPFRPAALRRDPGLSVLLITIDTLRADAVGAYGNTSEATPWLDRLAAMGVRFDDAHAHNVVTLPSHANILTGGYAFRHGIRDNSGFRLPPGQETMATLLKRAGWRTGAFVSAFTLDARFGLDAGFDAYDDRLGGAETHTGFLVPERRGPQTVEAAMRWLAAQGAARSFCFVHLYEPHFPYQPSEPQASRFPGRPYQAEVAMADAALEPLLRPILEAGKAGRTLVVMTADHGESLGEHGEATHGIFAYEATLHVPLIVYAPSLLAPAVVSAPVRHVDVLPTVLDLVGIAAPADLPGRSLVPVMTGGPPPPAESYFESLSASLNQGWAPLRGVLRDRVKYVDLPLPELYDLAADGSEAHNLAAARPQDLERLQGLLARMRVGERAPARVAEDAATLERLRALGYVASGGPSAPKERYTADDDPKRLIELDAQASEVLRLYYAGDLEGARALCRRLIQRRPDMPIAYLHLGFLERAGGDLGAAVDALRHAVALRPLDAESVALLGVYLDEAGRAREAADLLEPYTKGDRPDLDVLTARGMALAALGRREEALATFAAARRAYPGSAMVLVNTGTVYLMAEDVPRAREAFEEALRMDPGLARAQNSLGVIAARQGRLDEAVTRWKRAAELDGADYQTLFNLGSTLRRLGREAEARPYLEAYLRQAPAATEGRDIARVRAWLGESSGRAGGR